MRTLARKLEHCPLGTEISVFLTLLVAPLFCRDLKAGEQPCSHRIILVSVTDDKGRFAEGLTAASFVGKCRGKPVRILGASRDASSRRIVILLDTSGSMTEPRGNLKAEQALAIDFVRSMASSNALALIVFASEVEDRVDFGQDPAAVANKVADLRAQQTKVAKGHGKTALYDAILAGVGEFGQPLPGDIIYVITDGGENSSRSTRSQTERALLASGVRLFAFLTSDDAVMRGQTPEEETGPRLLRQLTGDSGGAMGALITNDLHFQQDLQNAVRYAHFLYSVMQESYRLDLQLPENLDKPRDWKLEVVDSSGKKDRHVQVIYPRLMPCSTQTGAN